MVYLSAEKAAQPRFPDPDGGTGMNSCSYCIHSHTAAARAKGMSEG